jgi:hypothetical protein
MPVRQHGATRNTLQKEVIPIDEKTTILIIMACLAFTTLVLKIVEMTRPK